MAGHLDIITAVAPRLSEYLPKTAASVTRAAHAIGAAGWSLRWLICVDGPGELPEFDATHAQMIRLPVCGGVSAARNHALAAAYQAGWSMPLDGDDEIEADGLVALLTDPVLARVGWASANRVLHDGAKTPHWIDQPRLWQPGELATGWVSPFVFHPNTLLVRTSTALVVGGWTALTVNEDLGFALAVSETMPGASTTHVVTRYRKWDGQTVAEPWYPQAKSYAFGVIQATLNARRQAMGRPPVTAPATPRGAHGTRSVI